MREHRVRIPYVLDRFDLSGTPDKIIAKMKHIKRTYGQDVHIELEIETFAQQYEGGHFIDVVVKRPENDEEKAARLAKEKNFEEEMREMRRKQFESLQKEFGES